MEIITIIQTKSTVNYSGGQKLRDDYGFQENGGTERYNFNRPESKISRFNLRNKSLETFNNIRIGVFWI